MRTGYRIVWSLKREIPKEGWTLDRANARIVAHVDQIVAAQTLTKKDVRQHELDRDAYGKRKRLA